MTIDAELLEILVCPDTHQSLQLADEKVVEKLNGRILAGKVQNVGGKALEKPLEAALVREDDALLYPVVDGIPVLLIDHGIAV
jgi:uncharacterized protein YbaR (Trm112 family)